MGDDVIREAGNYAWWVGLDGDSFTELVFETMKVIDIAGKEYKVEDYLTREQVKSFWDAAAGQIEYQVRGRYDKAQVNGLALWTTTGLIAMNIARIEEEKRG